MLRYGNPSSLSLGTLLVFAVLVAPCIVKAGEDCEAMAQVQKEYCLISRAVAADDLTLCNALQDRIERDGNRQGISPMKSLCEKELAVKRRDAALCQTVKIDYMQQACFDSVAQVKRDKAICSMSAKPDECLAVMADSLRWPEACDGISDARKKHSCRIEAEDVCAAQSEDACVRKPGCYWKNQFGESGPLNSCCPKEWSDRPERCNVIIN